MPVINVGVDVEAAKEMAAKEKDPIPAGLYNFVCKEVRYEDKEGKRLTNKDGQKQFWFVIEVFGSDNPDLNGKQMIVFAPTAEDGNTRGLGALVDIIGALGVEWNNGNIDTDACVNQTFQANVTVNGKYNNIASYV